MNDLFSSIYKYCQIGEHPENENPVTEMLAQVFLHEQGFCKQILKAWGCPCPETIEVLTQLPSKIGTLTKYPDMVLFDATNGGRRLLSVIEVKWWSTPSYSQGLGGTNEEQTIHYDSIIEQYPDKYPVVTKVYLTRHRVNPPPDWRPSRWAGIYRLGRRYLREHASNSSFGKELLRQFLSFLEEQEVNEVPIVIQDFPHMKASVDIYKKMETLFATLAHDLTIEFGFQIDKKVYKGMLGNNLRVYGFYGISWQVAKDIYVQWDVWPDAASFQRDIDPTLPITEDLPVATVRVVSKPDSAGANTVRQSDGYKRLTDQDPWHSCAGWTILHATAALTDILHLSTNIGQDMDSKLREYFLSRSRELQNAGVVTFRDSA